jgi:replication factor C subunit 3/5
VQQYPFAEGQEVAAADWELYVAEIASDMLAEQSAKRLYLVRGKLYELLVNCIPPELVMRRLALELARRCDDEVRRETMEAAAFFEHRLQLGAKAIFHLEAFVARWMSLFKQHVIAMCE